MERHAVWVDERSGSLAGAHESGGGPYEAETESANTAKKESSHQSLYRRCFTGTNDADDHLRLVAEFLRTSEQCNTRLKLEKCEFMQEEIEYLGFQVGWRWWRPATDKVAPLLNATIRDYKTRGVKDIRAYLGSCNFYRRHIPTFTYNSHLVMDLIKKNVPWKWTPENESQFQEIKEKLSSLRKLGTPARDGEFVVIKDASLVGGGGTLLQWQPIPGAAAKRIADEMRTVRVNRDGSLKQNYDPQEFHLGHIGH